MSKPAAELIQKWRLRLLTDCPEESATTKESILCWLLGNELKYFEMLDSSQLEVNQQAMEYRYQILRQRYLGLDPKQTYSNLIQRLGGSLVLLPNNIRSWLALNRNRTGGVIDVLEEIIQDLPQSDRYIRHQMAWIAQCTGESWLRNVLLFVSIEEYCLQPVCNRPLLIYRFVNHLVCTSRQGLEQTFAVESIQPDLN